MAGNNRNRGERRGEQPRLHAVSDGHEPSNVDAERILLGSMMSDPAVIDDVLDAIDSSADFYQPEHPAIYAAIVANHAAGDPTHPVAIAQTLRAHGEFSRVGGGGYLATLVGAAQAPGDTRYFARLVAQSARDRDALVETARLSVALHSGDPDQVEGVFRQLQQRIDQLRVRTAPAQRRGTTIDEFLAVNDEEDAYDWSIPGLLERGDRVVLTGPEGGGKSTFGRQVGVMGAAGIHPFTLEKIDPIRVLIVDLENSERQLRRALRPLRIKAGHRLESEYLTIEVRLEGMDLRSSADQQWLDEIVGDVRPDLVITGPIYKMADGDPTEEKTAKPVITCIDRIRAKHRTGFLLEAHTAKAREGQKKRPIEPYGASLWLRWPEFGIHLSAEGDVEHWRGQRDQRDWPTLLMRGGQWPWTATHNELEVKWRQIKNARFAFSEPMSMRDIEVATGIPKSTVGRVLNHYRIEWAAFNARNPGEDDL